LIENRDRAKAMQELRERARTFAISNRELEQFSAVVAHDLRAPLRHMNQFSSFLLAELGSEASDQVKEYLHIIQSSAASMSGMIERLLDYARIGAGAPVFETVSLGACLDLAKDLLQGELNAAGAVIESDDLPLVKGDKILLSRVFQNLIMNSLTYKTPELAPVIAIAVDSDREAVELRFRDNGIGIDAAHAADIFKMFSRLHSSSSYSGHGMGLAICKRVCEIHGGSIRLDTEFKGAAGSQFVIRLPKG
jgi:signal transduction histidine kinase